MILSCQNIEKAFLEKQVLKNCSFHIEDYEKAAIVGLNGAGKTTLLRIIVGQLEPDGGVVAFAKDKTFGYLAQDSAVNSDNTIYEELLSVKQHLLDLENQIRQAELSMKQLSGDANQRSPDCAHDECCGCRGCTGLKNLPCIYQRSGQRGRGCRDAGGIKERRGFYPRTSCKGNQSAQYTRDSFYYGSVHCVWCQHVA